MYLGFGRIESLSRLDLLISSPSLAILSPDLSLSTLDSRDLDPLLRRLLR